MPSKMKLVYFDVRGRAELIRLILVTSGVEFEDQRVQFADWPPMKADAPNGQLPYLEIEGKKYGESLPLARYLAQKYKLAGKNELECLSADIILSLVDNLRSAYVRIKFDSVLNEEQKKTIKDKFESETCPSQFGRVEKILTENKQGFLVGTAMTIADLAVVDLCDQIDKVLPEFLTKYPKVGELRHKIKNMPKIKEYLANRKDTDI